MAKQKSEKKAIPGTQYWQRHPVVAAPPLRTPSAAPTYAGGGFATVVAVLSVVCAVSMRRWCVNM